jgi:hypothetical protein
MSRPLIIELPAYGPSRGGNHPKTLRGPVGKERPAGPRSHIRERNALNGVVRRAHPWLHRAVESRPCLQQFCLGRMTRNSQEGWTILR